jgi:hypothetical protein
VSPRMKTGLAQLFLSWIFGQKKSPSRMMGIYGDKVLGCVLLSHGQMPHYHRRWCVSRPCSRWERVGPHRYGGQGKRLGCYRFWCLSHIDNGGDSNPKWVDKSFPALNHLVNVVAFVAPSSTCRFQGAHISALLPV